jgi:hypothetical protein
VNNPKNNDWRIERSAGCQACPWLAPPIHVTLFLACIFCMILAVPPPAKGNSVGAILANLGNVGTNGLPNLSFALADEHPDAAELKSLGFSLKLQHQVALTYGIKARTDWQVPALKTAVYFDAQGDLLWLHPDGRTVRFPKAGAGFSKASDGSSAKVLPDADEVEITTTKPAIWLYKDGFPEFIQVGSIVYHFKTDRDAILAIVKKESGKPLLEIKYSDEGRLSELVFSDGKKCLFQWSADNCLLCVHGDAGAQIEMGYDKALLKNWRVGDGALHELAWTPIESKRRLAFGVPPVLLGEDPLYKYHWRRKESVDILKVTRKSGEWVSQTHFSSKGIFQQTPYETFQHTFRRR